MSKDYFEDLPDELILLLLPLLSTASLKALVLTFYRLNEIIEARIAPKRARKLLFLAAKSKSRIVARLLSPPHSITPNLCNPRGQSILHMAVDAGNIEAAGLLLEAGANTKAKFGREQHQPLHLTVRNPNLEMMKLLLDHGAPIDATFGHDAAGTRWTALHLACANGHLDLIKLLLERGASLECQGHFGSALGFAVHRRQLDAVKILLNKGADGVVVTFVTSLLRLNSRKFVTLMETSETSSLW
jgi:ankyrin